MDKSIEKIWEKGFIGNDILIVPKINNLYKKKSISAIGKLKSISSKDNLSIVPLALITFIGFVLYDKIILAIYVASLMMGMFFLNKSKIRILNTIDFDQPCFEYLSNVKSMIRKNKIFYTKLLGIVFPFLGYLGFVIFILTSEQKEYIFNSYDLKTLIKASCFLLISFSAIGIASFRVSNHLIYNRLSKKINEIIDDLEELKITGGNTVKKT